jgi:outer membrane protein assembly factor BamB
VLLQTKAGTAARIIAGRIVPLKSAAGTTAFAATGEACTLGPNGIYYGTYPDLGLVAMTIEADELKQLWSYSEAKQFAGAPAVGPDGAVFVISTDGGKPALHAVGPDGKAKWTLPDAASLHVPLSPGPNGSVLAVNGDRTVALIAEGKARWSFTCNGTPQMPATWGPDGTIYLAAIDAENPGNGWVYALDGSGHKRWEFHTDGQVTPEIAVSPGGSVYVSTTAGLLYALSNDGAAQWRFSRDFEIYSPPAVGPDGTIYVAVRQMLYPVIVARDVGPGRVIVIGDSGFLLNYNLETEKEPESGMFHKPAIEFFKWLITTQLDRSQEAAK